MTEPSLDDVWSRLLQHQGQTFHQIRGGEFTYELDATSLRPSRTDWAIPKEHIEKALSLVPLANTIAVQHLYGPSYIYAVLMDDRVRGTDW